MRGKKHPYPLSRFRSNRCPAVTLSISYLYYSKGEYKWIYTYRRSSSQHNKPQFTAHLFYINLEFFSLMLQHWKVVSLHHPRNYEIVDQCQKSISQKHKKLRYYINQVSRTPLYRLPEGTSDFYKIGVNYVFPKSSREGTTESHLSAKITIFYQP